MPNLVNPITEEHRKMVSIFYGLTCIKDMFLYLDQYGKLISSTNTNTTKKSKPKFYLYFHNAKNFDSYMILNDKYLQTIPDIKFLNIIKSQSGLILLSISLPNSIINIQCTLSHLN